MTCFGQVAAKSNARENRALKNPEAWFVRRAFEVTYTNFGWATNKPLEARQHLEKVRTGWPVLTPGLFPGVTKSTYSKGWQFWADVMCTVHADNSILREEFKQGKEQVNIGQYFIPLIRWGSAIMEKVCAILEKSRTLGYTHQQKERMCRDSWVEYNTEVLF